MIKFIGLGFYVFGGVASVIVWIVITRLIWETIEDLLETTQQKKKTIEEILDIAIDKILIRKLYIVSNICTYIVVFFFSWIGLIATFIYFALRKLNSIPTEIDEELINDLKNKQKE